MARDRDARRRALAAAAALPGPSLVEPPVVFRSEGRLLIHGSGDVALTAASTLAASLDCHLLSDELREGPRGVTLHRLDGRSLRLSGGLGRFRALLGGDEATLDLGAALDEDRPYFDLVLELGRESSFDRDWGPPGHFHAPDSLSLDAALRRLPTLVGRVEKPKYFDFDSKACAHGPPGTDGCRRCIDACPAEAISSDSDRIAVDAQICQGGGACATVCPTAAISYRHPDRQHAHESLRCLILTYIEASEGDRPVLVLLDEHSGVDLAADWPGRALPWALHDVGSAGLDSWLLSLAFGAAALRLVRAPGLAASIARALDEQLAVARALLEGLGFPPGALSWMASDDDPLDGTELPPLPPLTQPLASSKPAAIRAAVEHFHANSPAAPSLLPLPAGAPLGRLHVRAEACTTCLSCAHLCPTGALIGVGGNLPQLRFVESDCVQCGLCQAACPEAAIDLEARLLLPLAEGRREILLHEDEAFACLRCGAPFAPAATIRAITERLADHPMFAGDALDILKCCDDCRLRQL